MKGWKTWTAVIGAFLYGIGGWFAGWHDQTTMMGFLTGAMAALGLGHKVEKK